MSPVVFKFDFVAVLLDDRRFLRIVGFRDRGYFQALRKRPVCYDRRKDKMTRKNGWRIGRSVCLLS
jgi:hypothetical protein